MALQFLFTTPITRPQIDGGKQISGIVVQSAYFDFDNSQVVAIVSAIEDGPGSGPSRQIVKIPYTGATTISQLAATLKSDIATALGVTFQ